MTVLRENADGCIAILDDPRIRPPFGGPSRLISSCRVETKGQYPQPAVRRRVKLDAAGE